MSEELCVCGFLCFFNTPSMGLGMVFFLWVRLNHFLGDCGLHFLLWESSCLIVDCGFVLQFHSSARELWPLSVISWWVDHMLCGLVLRLFHSWPRFLFWSALVSLSLFECCYEHVWRWIRCGSKGVTRVLLVTCTMRGCICSSHLGLGDRCAFILSLLTEKSM